MNKSISNDNGFSLIELVIAMAIMAALMGILAPTYIVNVEKTRESTDIHNLDVIRGAVVTAMADDAVYTEVMDEAIYADPLVVDLGQSGAWSLDTAGLSTYPLLQKELKATLAADWEVMSTVGKTDGYYILIEVTKDGTVSAYIADGLTKESSDAVSCKKTRDKNGALMKLLAQ